MYVFKHHIMKKYRGVEVQTYVYLTSVVDGGELLVSLSGHFIPGE
jgi:hypothetical protein